MKLIKIVQLIINHPFNSRNRGASLFRFVKWQIGYRLNPFSIIFPFTENSKLIVSKGSAAATGNFYCGLMEFNDMAFLLHFLRSEDLFIDVGANIGAYTILASSEIRADSIAIEPIPSTFEKLRDNISINHLYNKVNALNIGIGSKEGVLKFTENFDSVNHVALKEEENTIEVKVKTLDSILNFQTNHVSSLIKIDVEGFESEVIKGADKILNNNKLKAIIIELNGLGNRYGYDESLIHQKFLSLNFKPYSYDPILRKLSEISSYGNQNTIYIRDLDFVKERVRQSRKIKIGNQRI